MDLSNYYKKSYKKKRRKALIVSLSVGLILLAFGLAFSTKLNQIIFSIVLSVISAYAIFRIWDKDNKKWKWITSHKMDESQQKLLLKHVTFYRDLSEEEKVYFEHRIMYFLKTKKITAVSCSIDDTIRIFVAASAIIPVFSFPDFFYRNISEVLIYPDSFDENYNFNADEKHRKQISGMVGNGPMNGMMLLSKPDLLRAFDDKINADNVAIHEFVHLIDMADGATDGIPSVLLDRSFSLPWIGLMRKEMKRIVQNKSDISPYALTNDAEFLAVVSEYFFDSPERFMNRHPELYKSMVQIFKYNN